jgi:bifunctional UDP-N-acetylglucosamine pyrophosphorylase/glucosamine-1-phosphate N-acetyltransferase
MLTSVVSDPTGYGRIVRDDASRIRAVVEHKDADQAQRRIAEVNAGVYAVPAEFLRKATARLSTRNAQGEYYLTDIVAQAATSIGAVSVDVSEQEMSGVNDRAQLVAAERILMERLIKEHMKHVTFRDPSQVTIDADVVLEPDVEIGRNVVLRGKTRICEGARIDEGVILIDTVVGKAAHVLPYCISTQSSIGQQGQPPELPRRHHRRREGQHRRGYHYVQLQRFRKASDHHRRWRVHRIGHPVGGTRARRQTRRDRCRRNDHRRRA